MEIEEGVPNGPPDEPHQKPENVQEGKNEQPGEADVTLQKEPSDEPGAPSPAETQSYEPSDADQIEQPTEDLSAKPAEVSDATQPAEILPDEPSSVPDAGQQAGETDVDLKAQGASDITAQTDESQVAVDEEAALASGADTTTVMPGAAPAPVRKKSRYAPWFQILAVVLLVCVIGGVVLAVQARKGTGGNSKVTISAPTPIPPLKVSKWCVVNSAPVDAQAGHVSLNKVVALSDNDAWILGSTDKGNNFNSNTGRYFPLLEHWNGKTWSVVQTADTSALLKKLVNQVGGGDVSEEVDLNDMTVLNDDNIWAVGEISAQKLGQASQYGSPHPIMMINSAGQSLIEHWDGSSWQIVAHPEGAGASQSFGGISDSFSTVSAISANDIWAFGMQSAMTNMNVGGSTVSLPTGTAPLVEHWNGTSWTEQKLPDSLQKDGNMIPGNIQAFASDDVWASGTSIFLKFTTVPSGTTSAPVANPGSGVVVTTVNATEPAQSSTATPHLLHWDGKSWSEMKFPDDLSKNVMFQSFTVVADGDIWALGTDINPKDKQSEGASVIYNWNGEAWLPIANAPGVDPKSSLENISVVGLNDLWLSGRTSQNQPLLEHWNGSAWSVVTPASPAYGSANDVEVSGQRAWALVDAYNEKDAKNALPYGFPDATGTDLETNC